METEFCDLKNKNISAGELAKVFNYDCISLEDFKSFIEERGGDDKFLIDLLIKLFDDFSCSDLEKIDQSDVMNPDYVNKLISMAVDTSLVRFFKLSARLCAKYKNIEIGGKSIDIKKYFTDLFAMIPKKYICSKKEITDDIKKAIEKKSFLLYLVVEDINLDKNVISNYFNQILNLISIKGLDGEDKYLYDFIASVLVQYLFEDEFRVDSTLHNASLFMVMLCEITKRKMTKNKYCQKDKKFIDLVESLRKIYGDKHWISSLYEIHDGDFLKFISRVLNSFNEAKEPEEKTDEANAIKVKIFLRLLSLGIREALCNGYRTNFDIFFGLNTEHKFISKLNDSNLYDLDLIFEVCLMYFFSPMVEWIKSSFNGLENPENLRKVDDSIGPNFEFFESIHILVSSRLLNYMDDKNANKVLCEMNSDFAFLLGVILAKAWNLNDFIHAKKEYKLEKLFSYNCGFLLAFLMDEAIFGFSNATLEKYISSMRPDSKQKDKLKDMVSRISENIVGSEDKYGYCITSFLETLNKYQTEEKKLDLERVREGYKTYLKMESCKLAENKLINFLVEANRECFGDLANKENSTLNKIKDDQKPVPKLLDNINKYKDKCMII